MVIWTILLIAAVFFIATGFVPKRVAGSCRSAVKSISFEEAVNEAKETLGDRTGSELTYKVAFVLREKEAKMEMEKAIAVKEKDMEKAIAVKDMEKEKAIAVKDMEMEKAIAVKDVEKEMEKLLALQRKDLENECIKAYYKERLSAVVQR